MNQVQSRPQRSANVAGQIARTLALACTTLSASAVIAIWWFFVKTETGQLLDDAAFRGATYGQGKLLQLAGPILNTVSIGYVAISIVFIAAIALIQKRWFLAIQVAAVIVGANVTTQVLKANLGRPDFGLTWGHANSLPSGHTTVAAATSVALLLAVPRAWRPFVAVVGGGFTAAMGVSTLVGQWHRMSDVLAAILVTCAWGALVCAIATRKGADPVGQRRGLWTPAASVILLAVAVFAGGLAAWQFKDSWQAIRLGEIVTASQQSHAYLGSVSATIALSALVFTVLLLLRQSTARIR